MLDHRLRDPRAACEQSSGLEPCTEVTAKIHSWVERGMQSSGHCPTRPCAFWISSYSHVCDNADCSKGSIPRGVNTPSTYTFPPPHDLSLSVTQGLSRAGDTGDLITMPMHRDTGSDS